VTDALRDTLIRVLCLLVADKEMKLEHYVSFQERHFYIIDTVSHRMMKSTPCRV